MRTSLSHGQGAQIAALPHSGLGRQPLFTLRREAGLAGDPEPTGAASLLSKHAVRSPSPMHTYFFLGHTNTNVHLHVYKFSPWPEAPFPAS